MIVCPVCEHAQPQGVECDVCGKRLVSGRAQGAPAVPMLDGLEPTLQPRAPVTARLLPELEMTHHAAAPDVFDAMPGLDASRAPPVDVDAEPIPDLERTATASPADDRTALPAIQTCRYCRTPAMPGDRMCSRCGMRLPALGSAPAESAPATRLCSCGLSVQGTSCPSCGARMA